MQVLIVGGGRTGSELANLLLQEGHGVTVIEQRADLIPRLHKEIGKAVVMQGDGCEPTVLEQANIRKANVVAAVTGHDEDNLVICLLARQEFGVRRTGRGKQPKNEWLFTPEMAWTSACLGPHHDGPDAGGDGLARDGRSSPLQRATPPGGGHPAALLSLGREAALCLAFPETAVLSPWYP